MKRKILMLFFVLSAAVLCMVASAAIAQAQGGAGGVVYGVIYWTDMYGNLHPMSWGVHVSADDGANPTVTAYTLDGTYALWLPEGTYVITASSDAGGTENPAFFPASMSDVFVSPGSSTSIDFTLESTGNPVPELPSWAQPVMLLTAMVITVLAVRRYRVRPRA